MFRLQAPWGEVGEAVGMDVYNPDPTLKPRIIATELPAFIYKCLSAYNILLLYDSAKRIWEVCPRYFVEQQEEFKMERNPLFKFLSENTRYKEGNVVCMESIRHAFIAWLGKKVHKLDNGTFGQVNEGYTVDILKVCKHCMREAHKGCCEEYTYKDRTRKTMVRNLEMTNVAREEENDEL